MERREFFKRAALATAGVVAADQLDLVERLGWTRRLFSGFGSGLPTLYGDGIRDDTRGLQAVIDGRDVYDARRRRVIRSRDPNFITIPASEYRVSSTLHIRNMAYGVVDGSHAPIHFDSVVPAFLSVENCGSTHIRNFHIDGALGGYGAVGVRIN